MKRTVTAVLGLIVILSSSFPLPAQTPGSEWSAKWKSEDKRWIACHLAAPRE